MASARFGIDYEVIVKGNNLKLREGFLALANVTLIRTPDGPWLFDCGHYSNRIGVLKGLQRAGLTPADIKVVFLSHLHFDHANNIDLFPQARVIGSRREFDYAAAPHPEDILIPWRIQDQLRKHDLQFIEGDGELAPGIRHMAAPGHTPGLQVLILDTDSKGTVVLAGDAIKYVKEVMARRCDMAFDTAENGTASIRRILDMADRIVPGHFPELRRDGDAWLWDEPAELPLLIR
jgi:glyoxylase-like metal-dependent hydrolase (beta-lactamase superfamily II)